MIAPAHEKTKTLSFYIFSNLLLAVIIYFNAEIGRMLGIHGQPLAISVVWPSTGFALAALLIFGLDVWPGIFVGNFIYNFIHLYTQDLFSFQPVILSLIISSGSLLQAMVGNYIMRRYNSKGYFNSVRDIFIFLIPAGVLTCLIAPIIGVAALSFYSPMPWDSALSIWFTFWIGDTMGVYVFTPLLVTWTLLKPSVRLSQHPLQAVIMLVIFIVITVLTFVYDYPVAHLYIPLCIWVPYRFRMHGATLAIFLMTLAFVVFTSAGSGPFNPNIVSNQLIVMISFLEIIVSISLILAALVNEREVAWLQIQNHNIDLQQAVEMRQEELKEKISEISYQEKRASLGLLSLGVARQIQNPIERINVFTKTCMSCLESLKDLLGSVLDQIEPERSGEVKKLISEMDNYLENISKHEVQAIAIAQAIEEQSHLASKGRISFKSININTLLNRCLNEAINEVSKAFPGFSFITKEEFDRTVTMILAVPEDLGHAFYHLLTHAIYSMKEKKDKIENYSPKLRISTVELHNRIEITIHDNGLGIAEHEEKNFFFSFIDSLSSEEDQKKIDNTSRLHLSLAYDIITHIYRGTIEVDSKEGEYLEMSITIPKESHLFDF